MEVIDTDIADVKLCKPARHGDSRGFLSETWNRRDFAGAGIDIDFVQENHAHSAVAGTIRGLHFQLAPAEQAKLVRVVRGAVLDVAVDLRRDQPTYGCHVAVELSAKMWNQLWIPAGFAHGYCTLEADTEVVYKTTQYWAPDFERGIRWDDPRLGIDWRIDTDSVVLSDKDRAWPTLSEYEART